MGVVSGSAFDMGVELGFASYQCSVNTPQAIQDAQQEFAKAQTYWKRYAAAAGQDIGNPANPINLDWATLNKNFSSCASMLEAVRFYLTTNTPKTAHPWLEVGVWMGIAEGQSLSPQVANENSVPQAVIQDCAANAYAALSANVDFSAYFEQNFAYSPPDLQSLNIAGMDGVPTDPTQAHYLIQTLREKLSVATSGYSGPGSQ